MESVFGSVGRQVYTCLCCNLLSFAYGTSVGWASTSLPFLESNQTTLTESGPISKEVSSWIQSMFTIGGLLGSLIYGWISDRFGRKKSLMSIAIFQLISWTLVVVGQNWLHILLSRFIGGLGGGGLYIIIPIFVSEISSESIRGRLGSIFILAAGSGILFAYICGTYINYSTLPFVNSLFSILFLIGTLFHPESPYFLLQHQRDEEARNSIKFFKGELKRKNATSNSSNEIEMNEVEVIRNEFESIKSLINESTIGDAANESKIKLKDFSSKAARKVLTIGIGLMFLEQFSGVFALLFFVSTVFELSGSSLTPESSSIIVGIIQLIGAYSSTILVDKTGRRFLIVLSAFGISVGMLIFSVYSNFSSQLSNNFAWIPLASLSFVFLISNFGVLTLPFLVMSELMITLPKLRNILYSFCLSLSWIFAFLILKFSPYMIQILGISGLMFIFSINSLVGGLFVHFYVPETRDKTFQEISLILQS